MSEGFVHPLIGPLERSHQYARMRASLDGGDGPASVFGVSAGCRHQLYASLAADTGRRILIVTATESAAGQLADEIAALWPAVRRLPARDLSAASRAVASSGAIQAERVRALTDLLTGEATVIVASAESFGQPLTPHKIIADAVRRLSIGDCYEPKELLRSLTAAGYEPVDRCENPGQACLRGGRLDVYPVWGARPYRIEFFDDEIDTMREYDPVTQRATENVMTALIPPAGETPLTPDAIDRARRAFGKSEEFSRELAAMENGLAPMRAMLMLPAMYDAEWLTDYTGDGAIVILDEAVRIEERITESTELHARQAAEAMLDGGEPPVEGLLRTADEIFERLTTPRTLMVMAMTRQFRPIASKALFRIEGHDMPEYARAHDALAQDIATWHGMGFTVAVYAGSFAKRLAAELSEAGVDAAVTDRLSRSLLPNETVIIASTVKRGFEYPELKLAVISQRELYGQEERKTAAPKPSKNKLDMGDIASGDIVVHDIYGIGRYMGIEPVTVDGNTRDYLIIQYAGSDRLLLPTEQLNRLSRYVGGDAPRISKMGSADWQRAVARVRRSVKELAFDLMTLYGERNRLRGFRFSPDTPWQQEMEAEFPYQETPDQLTCIRDVKRDMESDRVMDRLICGDVGYGKTEVAVRAAFKAVQDGKQVAVLVPTTILAQQHFNTFTSRFTGFPVRVELLSRFKTAEEQRRIVETLKDGRTDVVIGTHKLLGKSIQFKDLGLLIIDEEQRFGVGHKEQIKNIKKQVAVLTMTATPIPRTLHMSMTGIRDMSVIETPPERRHPVQTYVMEYSPALAREVIMRELNRGGQTYFVYNDVKSMEGFAARLRELIPEARIAYAHGQLTERVLERTMLDFIEGRFDVLLCSTIIESGLDIPNVNTMLIYNADNMGLAQLYQLRGRVGRSSRLGYAYLTFMPFKILTEVAEKRLSAIREFTQFGAGFKIALKDLEIRGAGNLLGAEQHGHMAEIGYELYCRLMEQAVSELKGEAPPEERPETAMEIPVDAYLPVEYVPSEEDRLEMYRRIAAISDEESRMDVEDELIDRFGELPPPAARLMTVALLKADAQRAYITRINVSPGEVQIHLHPRAPIDGDRLLAFVTATQGVSLSAGDTPKLTYRRRGMTEEELIKLLPHFVYSIFNCITDANKI